MTFDEWATTSGVRVTSKKVATRPNMGEWNRAASHWRVTVSLAGRRMTVYYSQGSAHTAPPRPADVLCCLQLDASGADQAFESWCGDCGLDADSRKAYSTWEACRKTYVALERVLGAEFDTFMELEEE